MKYNTEELVEIGDYIHECENAFIIADNPLRTTNNKDDILFTMKGNKLELMSILIQAMQENEELCEFIVLCSATYVDLKMKK
jgi:hypothetical protein